VTEIAGAHHLAKPCAEKLIARFTGGPFEQAELFTQRNERLGMLQQPEGKIDIFEHPLDGAALPPHEIGNGT